MTDKRAFAKFDVGYLENPKIEPVLDTNPHAVLMHIASVLYCAQHLTDGEITIRTMQRRAGGNDDDARALVAAGLWHEPGHDCPACPQPPQGKAFVHDYLEHNRTSEGVKRASLAGKRGAAGRWGNADRMPVATASHADRNADRNADRTPNASEPQCDSAEIAMAREREERERNSLSSDAGASDPEFPEHVTELCDHLARKIRDNGNKVGTVGKTWHQAMDRLIRLDGYTPEQVRQVIDWCQQDEFWQGNILSAPKLREKFDQLKTRMFNARAKAAPTHAPGKPAVPPMYRMFNP